MVIRSARLDDAPAIATLTTQLGYPNLPEETEGRLRDILARQDGAVFVAEENGTVAGWIYLFGTHAIETEPFALIAGLAVDENRRSQGIGAALVDAAADWAVEHGYGTLRVSSNVVRERAHGFYERMGFSRAKNQVVFVRRLAT